MDLRVDLDVNLDQDLGLDLNLDLYKLGVKMFIPFLLCTYVKFSFGNESTLYLSDLHAQRNHICIEWYFCILLQMRVQYF